MRKLTATDIAELTAYFLESAPVRATSGLAAQSYEPGGGGTYTPVTDNRLVRLCEQAQRLSKTEWARVKRVVDQMLDAPGGDVAVRTLRLACSDPSAGWPEVACRTPTALRRGRDAAEEAERQEQLQGALDEAVSRGQSPITVAMRVLEADRRLFIAGVRVGEARTHDAARSLIRGSRTETTDAITRETDLAISAAANALRDAREQVGATARARRDAEERRRREFRDELRDKREAKERVRFEARLRRVG